MKTTVYLKCVYKYNFTVTYRKTRKTTTNVLNAKILKKIIETAFLFESFSTLLPTDGNFPSAMSQFAEKCQRKKFCQLKSANK